MAPALNESRQQETVVVAPHRGQAGKSYRREFVSGYRGRGCRAGRYQYRSGVRTPRSRRNSLASDMSQDRRVDEIIDEMYTKGTPKDEHDSKTPEAFIPFQVKGNLEPISSEIQIAIPAVQELPHQALFVQQDLYNFMCPRVFLNERSVVASRSWMRQCLAWCQEHNVPRADANIWSHNVVIALQKPTPAEQEFRRQVDGGWSSISEFAPVTKGVFSQVGSIMQNGGYGAVVGASVAAFISWRARGYMTKLMSAIAFLEPKTSSKFLTALAMSLPIPSKYSTKLAALGQLLSIKLPEGATEVIQESKPKHFGLYFCLASTVAGAYGGALLQRSRRTVNYAGR
nr:hypothetical protein [Tolivirales sp.]